MPDVIEGNHIGNPYPTEAFEVVVEILLPDSFSRGLRNSFPNENGSIERIVVIDPATRIWAFENGALHPTEVVARRGERFVSLEDLYREVDERLP